MKKIRNPFTGLEGFDCFGCSPDNPIGLKMTFIEDGDYVISEWEPLVHYQGYLNVLHGGIQAVLMDEIASWTVYVKVKTGGVTSSLSVDYIKPVFVNQGPVKLRAQLFKSDGRIATVHVELYNPDNTLASEARVNYYIYPEEVARRRFHYPGHDQFFDE
ncbi:MAG: hypothetical protein AMS27_13110 [Bacteroides sp. SM23_62_1]|nr:MAG: hypothetical protein AMS27_13110 [Bacteroides sp. SM23_62_1]